MIFACVMKILTRQAYLVEEQGMTYLANIDADNPLRSLHVASGGYAAAFVAVGLLTLRRGVLFLRPTA